MSLHVVLGKGPVGSALTERLLADGHEVRVLSRSGGASTDRVEHRPVDATDAAALTAAARGAAALYNCANPPYHRWPQEWPPLAEALLAAAESTGAVLVTMGNLYPYGAPDGPMTEQTPERPGTKGTVRARMWHEARSRHEAGALRATEARASDFVGPGVTAGGHLGERVVPRVLQGKSVRVIPPVDVPHSWTSVLDVAATLAVLGSDERAWGRVWHVPTAPAVSVREAVAGLCRAAGVAPVAVGTVPHAVLRVAGLVVPFVRELEEMRPSFTAPYVLDGSAVTRTFGLEATPLDRTWEQTVAWWRARLAAPAAA
jgi:nucleoside-diphosphate-sugar epimerase